jgi:Protein of unknown function (DUF3102)
VAQTTNTAAPAAADARDDAGQGTRRPALRVVPGGEPTPERRARVCNEIHKRIARRAAENAADYVRQGEELSAAKEEVGHRHWLRWVKKNLDFSERTAQRYMTVAKSPLAKSATVADLTLTGLERAERERRKRLRDEAGPQPGERVQAMHGPYPELTVREASDRIRVKAGLPPLPLTRREKARAELEKAGPNPERFSGLIATWNDGEGGKEQTSDPKQIEEAAREARKGPQC